MYVFKESLEVLGCTANHAPELKALLETQFGCLQEAAVVAADTTLVQSRTRISIGQLDPAVRRASDLLFLCT